MCVFERKILREISRPIKNKQGEFEMKTNEKLRSLLYKVIPIIGVMRSSSMRWVGHAWDIWGGTGEHNKMETGVKKTQRTMVKENKRRY